MFPLLLYNGDNKWTAATSIQDIIEKSVNKCYIPQFEYYPIIINEFSEHTLLKIHNVVSAIFFTENFRYENLESGIDLLLSILSDELPELRKVFANWFSSILENRTNMDNDNIKNKLDSMQEVKNMFTTTVENYGKKLIKQGLEQGFEQGIHKKALADAANMKKYNIPIDIICKVTDLSQNEVNNL